MKIGIIGLGFMGATHLQALSDIPDLQLAAIATTNTKALAGDLSQAGGNLGTAGGVYDFSGVNKYQDWRDVITDNAVEALDICLPTDLHVAVAVAALASGKHVLCEKPMSLDEAGCRQMLEAAARHGRVLMIGHVLRFWSEYESLHTFVETNAVRQLSFTRRCGVPDWSRWLPLKERSGGALLDLLIHDIDQAIWNWGMPLWLEARPQGPVDTVVATLHYSGNRQIRIEGGWLAAGEPFEMRFEAVTDERCLRFASNRLLLRSETEEQVIPSTKSNAYRAEVAYFAECCRLGRQPARCDPHQSAEAVRLANLLGQSRDRQGEKIRCSD